MVRRLPTIAEVKTRFLNLRIGQAFTDHHGRGVLKISDTEISLGVGFNNVIPIADYLVAIENGEEYGRYVVPGLSWDEWGYFVA